MNRQEARAGRALDRNRRLIEAGAVRDPRPAKLRQEHKPRKAKRRKRKQAPIPPRDLAQAVDRLNNHFQGEGSADPKHRKRRKPNPKRARKRELRQHNRPPAAEWITSARRHLAENKPPKGLRRDVADRLWNQARTKGTPKR